MGAPKMTDATIETAVQLLDGWRKKLHWDLYLTELESQINHRYTKAAMLRQPRIKSAWDEAKARAFASGESVHKGTALEQANHKILKLEHTVERLRGWLPFSAKGKSTRSQRTSSSHLCLIRRRLGACGCIYKSCVTGDWLHSSSPKISHAR